jgi:hypothetical protein
LIIDALAEYARITGIDLSNNPFAVSIERSNSPESILQLLQEREKAFNEYQQGNRRLINCLSTVVKVIQAFSGILGKASNLVSQQCRLFEPFNTTCSGPLPTGEGLVCGDRRSPRCTSLKYPLYQSPCDVGVFQAASGVKSSYDALMDIFESLGNFLKRLEVYTTIPLTQMMTDIIVKIMAELLSVLALTTKQIQQGLFSKCTFTYKCPILNMW